MEFFSQQAEFVCEICGIPLSGPGNSDHTYTLYTQGSGEGGGVKGRGEGDST